MRLLLQIRGTQLHVRPMNSLHLHVEIYEVDEGLLEIMRRTTTDSLTEPHGRLTPWCRRARVRQSSWNAQLDRARRIHRSEAIDSANGAGIHQRLQ